MIEARIKKRFTARPDAAAFALDIEFQAAAGVSVLFGPSGAGKTLTLDSIAGFAKPDEGRILIDDALMFDGAARVNLRPQERRCSYVFQNYALFPHMTLRQNLEFAAENRPRLERHRRVNEMLERFRLTEVAGKMPHELSGGQQQRCSIARALIVGPRLLLLDEPARGLDAPLRRELYQVLAQVRGEFATPILMVTHDVEECFAVGEEMMVIHDGRLVQTGAPRDVFAAPANLEVARLLGTFTVVPVEITALDPSRNTSKARFGDHDLQGPYYPGHLKGDRVWMCVPQSALRAQPLNGRLGANQVATRLVRTTERPRGLLVEFEGDLQVEMSRADFEPHRQVTDWAVEFPTANLRVLNK